MLDGPRDTAMLRLTLGRELVRAGRREEAIVHLRAAVDKDPKYTAAWKALGQALAEADERDAASRAYRAGIETAHAAGDKQAEKEMTVFLKRLEKG